ncbi:MAG: hypothetical protein E7585_00865 [Ruminococcaceae bacterium]|nr:hypothetical protein [Oscillospiraceae bacterium]
MREDRKDRVVRRSSTGSHREPERERRERIRLFDDVDDLYQDSKKGDDRRYRDDRYDDRYDEDVSDRREAEDRRYPEDRRRRREDERRPQEDDRHDRDEEDERRRVREPVRKHAGGPRRRRPTSNTERFVHQILPYVLFWLALFGAVSLVLRDLFHLDGVGGEFGSWFADFLCGLMGPIAYLLPLFFVIIALRWRTYVKEGILFQKLLLSLSFLVLLAAIVHVFIEMPGNNNRHINVAVWELYTAGSTFSGGGLFGGFVGEYMGYALYPIGTGLLAIPLLLIIGIYMIGMTPAGLWQRISTKFKQSAELRRKREAELYDGKEERKFRAPKQQRPTSVQNSEKAKLAGKAEQRAQPRQNYYDFGADDELFPPVPRPKRVPIGEETVRETGDNAMDLVDIPDDEPEEMHNDSARSILKRAGQSEDPNQKLNEILRQLEAEKASRAAAAAPVAPPTEATPEEKVPQGSYFAPFALPVRPEPRQEREEKIAAGHIVINPREAQSEPPFAKGSVESGCEVGTSAYPTPTTVQEEALGGGGDAPAHPTQVTYDNGVRTERHPSTTIYTKDPLTARAVPQPSPTVPAEPVPATLTAIEEPRSNAVQSEEPLERFRAAQEAPAASGSEPLPEMSSLDFEEETEPEVLPPVSPARGVRTSFRLPGEEPEMKEPAVAAPSALPRENRPTTVRTEPATPSPEPVRMVRPVVTRTEALKDEPKPTPPPPPTPREHRLPPIELLNEDKTVKETDHDAENQEKIEILRETLASFNVRIRDQIECARGPAITRYEFRPEVGVSVRQVINRQDDMALALAADVRIEAPVPGKPVIGIEVPNAVRETVYMRTLLESEQFKNSKKPLEVPIGLGIGGNIVSCDLASMPHVLVAGTTGSGKSVCINTILISLMYKTSPRDLRLILIDPKKVEFAAYAHVPHLYLPIVTEMPRAVGALACAVQEMERRYTLMEDVQARNIEEYNEITKNDPDREHLPYMVIVIDEFADLKMGSTTNDPENFTCRIAQKARAAGMHLIIGTQRPSVDVITGKLKNNIPSRIAFTVKSQVDSRTILDSIGAESLCGKGDMLYFPVSQNKPSRVQGAYVSGREVESVIRYIIEHNDEVQYNREFMDQIEVEMARAANAGRKSADSFDDVDDDEDGGEDPKFREAVELAIETQKVATSLLQRRLGVGYGRAAKIIDRMEELGYVSAPEGNKARKVLITYQEFMAKMGGDGDFEEDEFNT